jgi:hypothetical protein
MNVYSNLPKITMVLAVDDMGAGGGTCPHCGAIGRHIYRFTCDDGTERGAMRGCFSHFPQHRFAQIAANILSKEGEAARRGRTLASWDRDTLAAIHDFAAGRKQEWEVDAVIRAGNSAKAAYKRRRGWR